MTKKKRNPLVVASVVFGILIATTVIAFLVYRFIYTMNTGPSDAELKEQKQHDDEVVVPDHFDQLNASFDDSTNTDTSTLNTEP